MAAAPASETAPLRPNVWLALFPDGRLVLTAAKMEMGQGILTALAVMVAEELDLDPAGIEVRLPATSEFSERGAIRLDTHSSRSVSSCFRPMRTAAAALRGMLVAAAARAWGVPVEQCRVADGSVTHPPSGRRLSFGELAALAAREPVPKSPPLKRTGQFSRIGRPTLRLQGPDIVRGRLAFACDLRRPGLLYAALARPPLRGAELRSFDPAPALAVPGVRRVERVGDSVAVVAETTWDAVRGRDALAPRWEGGAGAGFSSLGFESLLGRALDAPSAPRYELDREEPRAVTVASAGAALEWPRAGGDGLLAEYATPFQAHAAMEPLNALAEVRDGRFEVWCGTQLPGEAAELIAAHFKAPRRSVVVHPQPMGGGFGRREIPDDMIEALAVARAVGGGPVQVFWTREDDFRHDYFHPATRHRLAARLEAGRVRSWRHRVAAPSLEKRWDPGPKDPQDVMRVETSAAWNLPYAFPDLLVEYVDPPLPLVPGFWRGIEQVANTFAVESFVDELAHAAGADPLRFRLAQLGAQAPSPDRLVPPFSLDRLRRALELAAERSGWGTALPRGRGRGVAGAAFDGRTACALVAEVSVAKGQLGVERVVCVLDCGIVVNPLGLAGNVESAVAWGLSALFSEITFEGGRPLQSNHAEYPILRLSQMPPVEVRALPSRDAPSGAGEIPVPLVAPAVCNAVFAATGRRLRRLPIRPEDLA